MAEGRDEEEDEMELERSPQLNGYRLARAQVEDGQAVWIPPGNFKVLLEDMLSRCCGMSPEATKSAMRAFLEQGITERYHLPALAQKTLVRSFGLRLGEAIEFQRAAAWITKQHELLKEYGADPQ